METQTFRLGEADEQEREMSTMQLQKKIFRSLMNNSLMVKSYGRDFPTGAGKVCRVGNKLTATHQHKEQDLFHYKRKSPSEGQQSPTLVHPVLHDQVSYDCLDKSNQTRSGKQDLLEGHYVISHRGKCSTKLQEHEVVAGSWRN